MWPINNRSLRKYMRKYNFTRQLLTRIGYSETAVIGRLRPAQLLDSPADTSKPHPHALLSALNVASAAVRPSVGYRAVR